MRWSLASLLVLVACSSSADPSGAGGQGTTTSSGGSTATSVSSTSTTSSTTSSGMSCGSEGPHGGDGTFYQGADGSGACSFAPIPGDLMVGAMNQTDYAGSAPCGACAEITGPSGKVTIRITDLCPECKPGDIDLSPEAFALIADLNLGRVHIDWHYVECAVNGPIVYHFKDGSNQYWTAIQIRNAKHAIAKIEGKDQNGAYQPLSRMDYNYFIASSGLGPGPYSLRVTDVYGGVVEDTGIPFAADTDAPGAAQLPSCP